MHTLKDELHLKWRQPRPQVIAVVDKSLSMEDEMEKNRNIYEFLIKISHALTCSSYSEQFSIFRVSTMALWIAGLDQNLWSTVTPHRTRFEIISIVLNSWSWTECTEHLSSNSEYSFFPSRLTPEPIYIFNYLLDRSQSRTAIILLNVLRVLRWCVDIIDKLPSSSAFWGYITELEICIQYCENWKKTQRNRFTLKHSYYF